MPGTHGIPHKLLETPMAQASKRVRKIRRIKRERSIAFSMYNLAVSQRDQARLIAGALEKELKARDTKTPEQPESNPIPALTITQLPEDGENGQ